MSNEKSTDEQKKIVEVKNVATDTKKVVDIIIPEEEEKVDNIIKLSQTYNLDVYKRQLSAFPVEIMIYEYTS